MPPAIYYQQNVSIKRYHRGYIENPRHLKYLTKDSENQTMLVTKELSAL